jgi:excisionase family DNA binding protein
MEQKLQYFSVEQLAARLQVNKKIIYALIKSGELPAMRVGKKFLRVPERAMVAWEQAQLEASSAGPDV